MDNISVIIRNKNEERYIGYAIQSVLNLFDKPEIIVVDKKRFGLHWLNIIKFSIFKRWDLVIDLRSSAAELSYQHT